MLDSFFIGTSGWSYPWTTFYPKPYSSKEKLKYYAQFFETTEVNYSFYHLPKLSTYQDWYGCVPDNFIFSLKLSRFITHIKRLQDSEISLKTFLQNASILKEKLGPILIQLPPTFKINIERLEDFLQTAKKISQDLDIPDIRFAMEFRHKEWFVNRDTRQQALKILKKNNVAFVFGHSSKYPYPSDEPITADFIYLRFHGPKELFYSAYGKQLLNRWTPNMNSWLKQGLKIYGYFNNTAGEYALEDAKILKDLLR